MDNELVEIKTSDDLKKLAKKMKVAFVRDQTDYIAKDPDGNDLEISEEEIEEMKNCDSIQGIFWNRKIISLVCSENEQDDSRWHLSVCKVVGPKELGPINEEEVKFITDAFFGKWQEIKSPSKMTAVRHFTGE